MKRFLWITPAVIGLTFLLSAAGCEMFDKDKDNDRTQKTAKREAKDMQAGANAPGKVAVAMIKPSAAATTQPSNNNVTGTVTFTGLGDHVMAVVDLKGLAPNSKHGFHIHEKGDLSAPDLSSAGAHFNPTGAKHGGPDSAAHHAGDLGNVTADAQGNVHTEMHLMGVSLDGGGANSIVGRSVIVHAKDDDLKSDPSGNSGGRIAGGVIEMKK
jgi:Cu-Zn family superoxide dismutase